MLGLSPFCLLRLHPQYLNLNKAKNIPQNHLYPNTWQLSKLIIGYLNHLVPEKDVSRMSKDQILQVIGVSIVNIRDKVM